MQNHYNENELKYKELDFLGFPDYMVGTDGSVWSKKIGIWVRLNPYETRNSYLRIDLRNEIEEKPHYVHRLVLEAFRGPCPEGMEARHFPDRNVANNTLTNLSWGTHYENMQDKKLHGTSLAGKSFNKGERNGQAKLTENEVRDLRQLAATGNYKCQELANKFNVSVRSVGLIINRKRWKHVVG